MTAALTTSAGRFSPLGRLEHDPEKWVSVFPWDKREAFARRSYSNNKIERNDDSKKSHPAPKHDPEKWVPVFRKDHA
jgi:hypothetical protein